MSANQFKVLLVDDSEAINEMNRYFFEQSVENIEIVIAKNGKEALTIIKNKDNLKLPDLVMLDLKMPVLDGFEFLTQLEELDLLKKENLNVILLTTSMNPEDAERIKKYSFVRNYLVKPLSMRQVSYIVTTHLNTVA